jgi:hypothetical protein
MKLMGLDDSGKCPICMATDSLEHIMFDCNYSAAVHKRQDWISGIRTMLHRQHRQPQTNNYTRLDFSIGRFRREIKNGSVAGVPY